MQALGSSGHKKKRAREKETREGRGSTVTLACLPRARPSSLSPTTSKRLLRGLCCFFFLFTFLCTVSTTWWSPGGGYRSLAIRYSKNFAEWEDWEPVFSTEITKIVCDWTTVVIGNQRPVKTIISDLSESSIPSVKIPLVSSFHSEFWSGRFANWRKWNYSQLAPCGHRAITETPIIRTAANSPAKKEMFDWNKLPQLRTPANEDTNSSSLQCPLQMELTFILVSWQLKPVSETAWFFSRAWTVLMTRTLPIAQSNGMFCHGCYSLHQRRVGVINSKNIWRVSVLRYFLPDGWFFQFQPFFQTVHSLLCLN